MATTRDTPYGAFNFLVSLGDGNEEGPLAGFSEVSGLNAEVTVAEYRAGNSRVNYPIKIPGVIKAGDVTLKRGVCGSLNLMQWLNQIRWGDVTAKRNVVITLQDEAHNEAVLRWKLHSAMPIKWTGPTLSAKGGTDVAIEELVLAVEHIEME